MPQDLRPRYAGPSQATLNRWSNTIRYLNALSLQWDVTEDRIVCVPPTYSDEREELDWRGELRAIHVERGYVPLPPVKEDLVGAVGRLPLVRDPRSEHQWIPTAGIHDVSVGHFELIEVVPQGEPLLTFLRHLALVRAAVVELDVDGAGTWRATLSPDRDAWTLARRAQREPIQAGWVQTETLLVDPPAEATDQELTAAFNDRLFLRRLKRAGERDPRDPAILSPHNFDSQVAQDRRNWSHLVHQMEERLIHARRAAAQSSLTS